MEEADRTLEDRVQQTTKELQEAQALAVCSEKLAAVGQLAGGIARDLRSPLGAIDNAIFYLKKKLGPSEVAQANPRIGQFLTIAEEEVAHSNAIISDLMGVARVGAPSLSATKLAEVLDSAVSTAVSKVEARGNVRTIRQLDPDLPELMADPEQFYRVFLNLAGNAYDAMPEGGELTIITRPVDGCAEVSFQDTGVGIGDEDMGKIFEPLYTTKAKGTGFGLAVSQQVVAKHGGAIQASSVPGQGSTFTIRLPLAA